MRDMKNFFFLPFLSFICTSSLISCNEFADEAYYYSDGGSCDYDCQPQAIGCCEVWEQPFRAYVDHVEGRWLDNNQGYTSLGSFIALENLETDNFLPFLDVRGHLFNDGRLAANIGGGVRFIDRDNRRVFGVNAYYDFRDRSHRHQFHQIGVGAEMLTDCWDLRLNGYFPVNGNTFSKTKSKNFGDGFFATCRERIPGMWGGDIEVGRWLMRRCPCDCFDLYGAVGAYYFSSKHHKDVIGGEVRLAADVSKYFNFEVRAGYDQVYRTSVQGRVTLTVPFESLFCSNRCADAFCSAYQPVRRQEIIVNDKKDCCWTWNWDCPKCNCDGCAD